MLDVAAEQAAGRRGSLAVVVKSAGIPAVSGLWQECALDSAGEAGVECSFLEVDHAAFQLIQQPHDLDVVAAPDLYGDVLADLGGVLLGSARATYSGNFSSNGAAVYQTNHGCAYDIAGTDTANPAGQIQSLAMLLRDSFGLDREAALIEEGLRATWAAGWRTRGPRAPRWPRRRHPRARRADGGGRRGIRARLTRVPPKLVQHLRLAAGFRSFLGAPLTREGAESALRSRLDRREARLVRSCATSSTRTRPAPTSRPCGRQGASQATSRPPLAPAGSKRCLRHSPRTASAPRSRS